MTAHNLKHSNAHFPFHLRCLRLFALCFANNTYSQCLSSPANSLAQITALCLSDGTLSLSLPSPEQWFLFSKAHSEMALFSDSHSVAPSAGACQEVRLPELEPGPVYTNSSEKYGCIIIEVVSFNVASSLWKPLHAWSVTTRGGL